MARSPTLRVAAASHCRRSSIFIIHTQWAGSENRCSTTGRSVNVWNGSHTVVPGISGVLQVYNRWNGCFEILQQVYWNSMAFIFICWKSDERRRYHTLTRHTEHRVNFPSQNCPQIFKRVSSITKFNCNITNNFWGIKTYGLADRRILLSKDRSFTNKPYEASWYTSDFGRHFVAET